jgi:hypothetical protein
MSTARGLDLGLFAEQWHVDLQPALVRLVKYGIVARVHGLVQEQRDHVVVVLDVADHLVRLQHVEKRFEQLAPDHVHGDLQCLLVLARRRARLGRDLQRATQCHVLGKEALHEGDQCIASEAFSSEAFPSAAWFACHALYLHLQP